MGVAWSGQHPATSLTHLDGAAGLKDEKNEGGQQKRFNAICHLPVWLPIVSPPSSVPLDKELSARKPWSSIQPKEPNENIGARSITRSNAQPSLFPLDPQPYKSDDSDIESDNKEQHQQGRHRSNIKRRFWFWIIPKILETIIEIIAVLIILNHYGSIPWALTPPRVHDATTKAIRMTCWTAEQYI